MTANNGWPGKSRVPINPERDGWHWLKTPDNEVIPFEWRVAGECERGRWPSYWVRQDEDCWTAEECEYIGPCLTHDEATALQARADRNAAGFARVDAEAERAKFLHKQEIAALKKRCEEAERTALQAAECHARETRRADALQKRVAELEAENAAFRNNKTEEEALREMMRDPRYWRHRDPEWVNKVRDGFRKLIGGKNE